MRKFTKDIVEVCLKEDLQKVLHKASDLKESAFGREFARQMKLQHGPGAGKTFDWHGTKIALKYADKPAAPTPGPKVAPTPKPAEPQAAPSQPKEPNFTGRMIPPREAGIDKIPAPEKTQAPQPQTQSSREVRASNPERLNTPIVPLPAEKPASYSGADAARDAGEANKSRNDFAKDWNRNPNKQQFSTDTQSMNESVVTVGANKYKVI